MKDMSSIKQYPPLSSESLIPHILAHQKDGRPLHLAVTGISMIPFLHPKRDSVLLVSPEQRKVRRGEILLCRRPDGSLVMHRCLKVYKNGAFLLNGDSQQWRERLPADSLLAVVDSLLRKGRHLSCNRLSYRMLVGIWMFCRPIRPLLFRTVARLRSLFGRPDSHRPSK